MPSIMHSFLVALTLGTTALGSPKAPVTSSIKTSTTSSVKASTTTTAAAYSISQVSEFDNIAGIPGVAEGPVGSNSIYDDLLWNGFSLTQTMSPAPVGAPGIAPQSNPNIIAFSQTDVETIDEGQPAISVNYPDSSISYFSLSSFYYGCTLSTKGSVAGVPISCAITVTGFGPPSSGSKQLATQTFNFVSNGGVSQNMAKGIFSSAFQGLYAANFFVSSAQTNLTSALLDNVANKIFSNSPVVVN